MTISLPSIAILGAGSMGGAILSGLVRPTVEVTGGIRVTNRSTAKAAAIAAENVTSLATDDTPNANRVVVRGARVVVIGVKPGMVADVLAEIADALEPDAVIVSVAAGVTITSMEAVVPGSVVRAMPNTPAVVGRAVTGVAAGSRTTPDELELVRSVFGTVGEVLVVPESKIDALSAVSGSGPAYVFYLIEQLTRTAIDIGFTPDEAAVMVNTTFLGSAELLASSGETPEVLRARVTSPNGTTERAIAVLQDARLDDVFARATAAAIARARELATG
jgi:pyrroline-5-carboxylate reductase